MPQLIPVLTKEAIRDRVVRVARAISVDYRNSDPVLIGVLKGAFIFLSDLVREISIPVKIDFVEAASYGSGMRSTGKVRITKDIETDVAGKDVLLVEDIVDTGLTLAALIGYIESMRPKTVRVCALLSKSERREAGVQIDYVCHDIPNGFLVGYGLDYAGDYRHLPQLYELKF